MADATSSFKPLTPRQINDGRCNDWAWFVWNRMPGTLIGGHRIDAEGHAYIFYRGRYYDAETPKGVKQWWQLPWFRRAILGHY